MKAEIREQMCQIAFPQSTSLKPPVVSGNKKGAKKRGAHGECSTTRSRSYWQHVEARFPDSQSSQTKPLTSKQKGERIGKFTPTQELHHHIPLLNTMPLFMHPHIDDIVNVKGDGYCGFCVIALDTRKNADDYELIRLNMQKEISLHKETYLSLFGSTERLQYINDAFFPPLRTSGHGIAPKEKWLTFSDMGHIIASYYNKVVVLLTKNEKIGASQTFFPLRGTPPQDPASKILCIGKVDSHFVYVNLKKDCPLPPTYKAWRKHCTQEASSWESSFIDRQAKFVELMDIEKGEVASKRKVGVGDSKDKPLSWCAFDISGQKCGLSLIFARNALVRVVGLPLL
ncbi:receptor-like protein kinase, partial [Trifolium medium]|nr:receptor-like protein kinase [Trifolium medium]